MDFKQFAHSQIVIKEKGKMSTENLAQSMQQAEQNSLLQQKPAVAPHKEQVTKAEWLNSMTGKLEESELEAVSGGY